MLNEEKLKNIQNELSKFQTYFSEDDFAKFNKHLNEKLKNLKPVLMIYGSYNAGKSSLLNALYGEEELAKTGDAPETKEVHKYNYKNFDIYDTPGLNANNADNITSHKQLLESDIIIFVISSDGGSFEEKHIYEKIIQVARDNKPMIIVINNKTNVKADAFLEIKDKISSNIIKEAEQEDYEGISKSFDIVLVNAILALKGKKENKKVYEKNSGIIEFQELIDNLLQKSGKNEVINSLKVYILDAIDKLLKNIDSQISDEESRKLQELLTQVQQDKNYLAMDLKDEVYKSLELLKNQIFDDILAGSQESQINDAVSSFIKDLNQKLNSMIQKTQLDVNSKVEYYVNALDLTIENSSSNEKVKANIFDNMKTTVDNFGLFKIPSIPLVVIVEILSALFGNKNKNFNERENQRARQQEELAYKAKDISQKVISDLKNKYNKEFFPEVDENFKELISKLKGDSAKISGEQAKLLEDKEELKKLQDSL